MDDYVDPQTRLTQIVSPGYTQQMVWEQHDAVMAIVYKGDYTLAKNFVQKWPLAAQYGYDFYFGTARQQDIIDSAKSRQKNDLIGSVMNPLADSARFIAPAALAVMTGLAVSGGNAVLPAATDASAAATTGAPTVSGDIWSMTPDVYTAPDTAAVDSVQYVDNWDMQLDSTVSYQNPTVMDLPPGGTVNSVSDMIGNIPQPLKDLGNKLFGTVTSRIASNLNATAREPQKGNVIPTRWGISPASQLGRTQLLTVALILVIAFCCLGMVRR
jgi:hypothetical protein